MSPSSSLAPDDNRLVDTLTIIIGVLTVLGSVIAYFIQRDQDRKDAIEAKRKEDEELDRSQGLERVRKQLSLLIGPLHRLWKTHTTITMCYQRESGHGMADYRECIRNKGESYWITYLMDDYGIPYDAMRSTSLGGIQSIIRKNNFSERKKLAGGKPCK